MEKNKGAKKSAVVEYLESMSQYKKDALAAATIEFIQRLKSTPEGCELLKRKQAELEARGVL